MKTARFRRLHRRVGVLAALVFVAMSLAPAAAQPSRAPEIASYRMDVRLDPAAKTVTGSERITYRNPSPDTLNELWLRLYLKAFSRTDTIWMREGNGENRGNAADPANLGGITITNLTLADGTNLLTSATVTDTLMRLPLPAPLPPDQRIELEVQWTSKLPRVFARTGYGGRNDTFFMVGQWYPKMAVYDRGRWDTEPWHQNAEFFSDFGSYDVAITLPKQYVVAGVGVPAGESPGSGDTKIVRFAATDVTDFAWAASPDFRTRSAKAGAVDVALFYLPEHESSVAEYIAAATGSLESYSAWYGAYPHPRLTVVDVPDNAAGAGGMEYPTLVTGGTLGAPAGSGTVALVTAHEVAHQWWPMQTATNEGREPWLDEGLAEYGGMRYMAEAGRGVGFDRFTISNRDLDRIQYAVQPRRPSNLLAWQYDTSSYGIAVYNKTGVGLWTLENVVGTARFRRAMADYLAAYRFKHPTAADFEQSMQRSLGGEAGWFFADYINGSGVIDYAAAPIRTTPAGSIATIQRVGDVRAPVEIRLTRAGGAQQITRWDGATPTTSYTAPASDPFVRVEVDPQQKLVAEIDVLNNDQATQPQLAPAITVGGGLSFWLQGMLNLFGLVG